MFKTLFELFWAFASIGALTFGGGLAMLAMLKNVIVDKKGWATEDELLDYYAIGQCTPGIIAVNTATFIGYKKGKIAGAFAATLGMVTPSIIIILIVASALDAFMESPILLHALSGIRAAVCALMLTTIISMAKKSLVDYYCVAVFAVALVAAFFLNVPSIFIVLLSGALGVIVSKIKEKKI